MTRAQRKLPVGGRAKLPPSKVSRRKATKRTQKVDEPRDNGGWRAVKGRTPKGLRRNPVLDGLGWYEAFDRSPVLTSTRQAAATNPALLAGDSVFTGAPIGVDDDTGRMVGSDPFTLYDLDFIQSLNAVVIGDVGVAKSTLVKDHYVQKQLGAGRQVCVFDRKDQEGEGEYRNISELVERSRLRVARVAFRRDGTGACVNPLDLRISRSKTNVTVGQDELLVMVAEMAHGRLNSRAHHALRAAHRQALAVATEESRDPILADVVEALFNPSADAIPHERLSDQDIVTVREVTEWGLDLALDLSRFLDGDLSGLLNGPTRNADGDDLDLDADLIVIDTSSLQEGSAALMMVMAIMATYLSSVWSTSSRQSVLVIEEGYSAEFPAVAQVLRSMAKRGRGIGLSLLMVVHHLSDIDPASDLASLFKEAGVIHLFRQEDRKEAEATAHLFGFHDMVEEITQLEKGVHILKEGPRRPPRKICHVQTNMDKWVTYTDAAITGGVDAPRNPFEDEPRPSALFRPADDTAPGAWAEDDPEWENQP